MKKIFLSAFVIISFVLYAWTLRVKGDTQTPAIVPNTIGKKMNVTPTIQVSSTSAPSSSVAPSSASSAAPTAQSQGQFNDGIYTGSVADAFYGPLQVKVTISGGKISDVQFLQSPNDRSESIEINQQAGPQLTQEAIQAQSAQVDVVSGATQTSQAFVESMKSALSQAKS